MSDDLDQKDEGEALAWTLRVPMVGDRFFATDILRWVVLTGVMVSAIVVAIAAFSDGFDMLPTLLGVVWAVVAALFLLSFLIALVVFRNHYFVRYALDAKGAHYAMVRSAKDVADLTGEADVILGAITGSAATAGAGLLAKSRRDASAAWSDVKAIRSYDAQRVIALKNGWRTLFRLRTADDASHARVKAFVHGHVA